MEESHPVLGILEEKAEGGKHLCSMLFTRGVIWIELDVCLIEGVNDSTASRCKYIAEVTHTRMELGDE